MKRSDAEYALAICLVYMRELYQSGQAGCLFELADRILLLDDLLDQPTDLHLAEVIHGYKGEHVVTKHRRP